MWSQIIRPRESLALHKSFNSLLYIFYHFHFIFSDLELGRQLGYPLALTAAQATNGEAGLSRQLGYPLALTAAPAASGEPGLSRQLGYPLAQQAALAAASIPGKIRSSMSLGYLTGR